MTYLDAVKKAKRENIGHSVGAFKKLKLDHLLILNQVGREHDRNNKI